MNYKLLAFLLFSISLYAFAKPRQVPVQLLDETSLSQVDSEELENLDRSIVEDISSPIKHKPHKMADRKHKRVDGSPIEKVDEMRGPMDMSPTVDLFQQLMVPIDNGGSTEMERLFNMRYEKYDENPKPEGPK